MIERQREPVDRGTRTRNRKGRPGTALPAARGSTWWSRRESNPRPPECHSGTLPTELRPHEGAQATPVAGACQNASAILHIVACANREGILGRHAGVAKLVYAGDSKSPGRKVVRVRVPPPAPRPRDLMMRWYTVCGAGRCASRSTRSALRIRIVMRLRGQARGRLAQSPQTPATAVSPAPVRSDSVRGWPAIPDCGPISSIAIAAI
jgi:hypothetical protein